MRVLVVVGGGNIFWHNDTKVKQHPSTDVMHFIYEWF